MRELVAKKRNQLIDEYNERRDEAAQFIQQSWESFVEQRKKKERSSRAIGVIEGAVKYYLVRKKWIQSLNQLRARIRLKELIKLNESAAMKSVMMTLKVSLHEVNHLQRLQSLMSSSNLTDENPMYQVLRMKRAVQVIGSFFKYMIIRNRWLEVMKQVKQQIIQKENITTSAIMIQRFFRSFLVRKKLKQIVTEVMKAERRRKQIEAMSEASTPITITGGIAIAFLVYLLTCNCTHTHFSCQIIFSFFFSLFRSHFPFHFLAQ